MQGIKRDESSLILKLFLLVASTAVVTLTLCRLFEPSQRPSWAPFFSPSRMPSPPTHDLPSTLNDTVSHDATHTRTVALVFYGRARFVELLDCYLQRNLVANGGSLDEVLFLANTWWQPDLDWLDKLVERVPQYKKIITGQGFSSMWEHANEPDTIYVKIDDDIVWMDDGALPSLVKSLRARPEALAIAANIINSPLAAWMHRRMGAIQPFLPESTATQSLAQQANRSEWRTSTLPVYPDKPVTPYNYDTEPSFEGSRMLPLSGNGTSLQDTPINGTEYSAYSRSWANWAPAAQQHYSLFWNLEHQTLPRYYFGDSDGIFNLAFDHYSINTLAIWGRDVDVEAMNATKHDDEMALTVDLARALDRPVLVDTHALVSHYSFGSQQHMMPKTDVLTRYRALANQVACLVRLQGDAFSYAAA